MSVKRGRYSSSLAAGLVVTGVTVAEGAFQASTVPTSVSQALHAPHAG